MLLAVARLDAPDAVAAVNDGNQLCARRVHLGKRGLLGVRLVDKRAVFVREIALAVVQNQFALGTEVAIFAALTVISIIPV